MPIKTLHLFCISLVQGHIKTLTTFLQTYFQFMVLYWLCKEIHNLSYLIAHKFPKYKQWVSRNLYAIKQRFISSSQVTATGLLKLFVKLLKLQDEEICFHSGLLRNSVDVFNFDKINNTITRICCLGWTAY